jgi:UDP-N-acetylmuramate--alanine ligase
MSGAVGDQIAQLIAAKAAVHCIGACGVGMAGIAAHLQQAGLAVTGCDSQCTGSLATWLGELGIPLAEGQAAEHVTSGVAWVVRTAAVPDDHPEVVAAQARGLPVFRRGEVLPVLVNRRASIAVAGTHGKTTTSTLIAQILAATEQDPAWCIGGECAALGPGVAGHGAGDLVVEADESDGTLADYAPSIGVITNVEFDHMEHFDGIEDFEACFGSFVSKVRECLVVCADDARACRLAVRGRLTYGFTAGADVRIASVERDPAGCRFELVDGRGELSGWYDLPVTGRHNVLNATAAICVAGLRGVTRERVAAALAMVALPRRRFECVASGGGVLIVSDYAHHPTEIAAAIEMAGQSGARRVRVLFQPHRYTRTQALGADFPSAFAAADEVVLVPVYAAAESPLPGGRIWDLYRHFREQAEAEPSSTAARIRLSFTLMKAWDYFRETLEEGDLLLICGAGDVEQVARWAAEESGGDAAALLAERSSTQLQAWSQQHDWARYRCKAGRMTTFGVGGEADVWCVPPSEAALAELRGWSEARAIPFRVIGGGSNILISDLGLRGVTVRLGDPCFRQVREERGAVVFGGGMSLAAMLGWMKREGRGGLEFMTGIPGTVGGATHMNAGAWRQCLGERIAWIRALSPDGSVCIVERDALGLEYRHCKGVEGLVVLEVAVCLEQSTCAAVTAICDDYGERRRWQRGIRCAGSVFRNPEDDYAGRLIEELGLKGASLGGASVSLTHANITVANHAACASDVLALTASIRDRVAREQGVELRFEVKVQE